MWLHVNQTGDYSKYAWQRKISHETLYETNYRCEQRDMYGSGPIIVSDMLTFEIDMLRQQ